LRYDTTTNRFIPHDEESLTVDWNVVFNEMGGERTIAQCRHRWECTLMTSTRGQKLGAWTEAEVI
jgi:hypothetical protein